jgi:hypothetical protein
VNYYRFAPPVGHNGPFKDALKAAVRIDDDTSSELEPANVSELDRFLLQVMLVVT